jgi:hypothetical protein
MMRRHEMKPGLINHLSELQIYLLAEVQLRCVLTESSTKAEE